ncbi:hypothetical protein VNO77_42777 [Canavalia gladiata]|uniref:Uncharacterized protein n=1 Tax=Canavalia gladiata TaxID=3824 RepID=A0AAN9JWH5_CANGL
MYISLLVLYQDLWILRHTSNNRALQPKRTADLTICICIFVGVFTINITAEEYSLYVSRIVDCYGPAIILVLNSGYLKMKTASLEGGKPMDV